MDTDSVLKMLLRKKNGPARFTADLSLSIMYFSYFGICFTGFRKPGDNALYITIIHVEELLTLNRTEFLVRAL